MKVELRFRTEHVVKAVTLNWFKITVIYSYLSKKRLQSFKDLQT